MIIPEKMKVNKFKEVRIPSKSEYFNTGRYRAESGTYGGEEEAVNVTGTHKVDNAADLVRELDKEVQ